MPITASASTQTALCCSRILRFGPPRRTTDGEETNVIVTSSGGFILKRVFYTVPSRLIGHRLRVRRQDDRLDLYLGATHLLSLQRGRGYGDGKRGHIVDYRHVIHALRRKPMALPGLVYRDQLFPRDAYRQLYDAAMAALPEKVACKLTVDILALAHERGCEAELATLVAGLLAVGALPDMVAMRERFSPDPATLPNITVLITPLSDDNALLAAVPTGEAA